MALAFESAQFIKSAAQLNDCPADVGAEVAFAGRSNAGKSSAINCLTRQTRLARTSKTPGRTQLLNFFSITPTTRLVDLPGYGYAKVPQAMRDAWHRNIDGYLRERMSLVGIVLVMDVRHPMKPFDEMMLEWSSQADTAAHLLLTKSDKLSRGAASGTLARVRNRLPPNATVQLFSATTRQGREVLADRLTDWLAEPAPE
ncbi:MAG: YihA family ribosome biogenesis GTP-binding protein [Gammaproteobacteria bacterium]|nr:YihA family ribosome biogenesis GTP-binding protein [Gammaproteobacteria bacterium]